MKKQLALILVMLLCLGVTVTGAEGNTADTADLSRLSEDDVYAQTFPNWNPDAPALKALIGYVEAVTDEASEDFIPPEDRTPAQKNADKTSAAETKAAETGAEEEASPEDIQYVMYVGTNDKDTNKPVCLREEALEKAGDILMAHFGGYTIQTALGGWKDDDGTEYREFTLVIYLSDTTPEAVRAAADELIAAFNQSSVLIQANPTKTEFYGGQN